MPDQRLQVLRDSGARRAFAMHDRAWRQNRYVYPVVSRRSKGISIGVNLNPDKACNFDCIYCSVDRSATAPKGAVGVDVPLLRTELAAMLDLVSRGDIYQHDPFDTIPPALRRLNDIAFSGDGEPTTFPEFAQAVAMAAELKRAAGLADVKLVLISNATMFHRPVVREGLAILDGNNGEIWGKLDAGSAEYYALIDRTAVPFQRVLDNLLWAAQVRPIVIQSLLMKVHGNPPAEGELDGYIGRLAEIGARGGRIKLVQLYTVARQTTEAYATPLSEAELSTMAHRVEAALPGLAVEVYP